MHQTSDGRQCHAGWRHSDCTPRLHWHAFGLTSSSGMPSSCTSCASPAQYSGESDLPTCPQHSCGRPEEVAIAMLKFIDRGKG